MEKSTHRVEIVPVSLNPHPNADLLSVIPVFGYTYVGRTQDWLGVKRAAYIPPDSLVNVCRPEFAFLAEQAKQGVVRIKAKKLRGVVSFGLMVPVPDETPIGEDWAEKLGVEHYEPPLQDERGSGLFTGCEAASPPRLFTVKYDVDSFRRYHHLFVTGESVMITEKLDGTNSRFVYFDDKMYAGSRTEWKKEFSSYDHITVEHLVAQGKSEEQAKQIIDRVLSKPKRKSLWWEVLEKTPTIEKFCRDNPGHILYGEIFGNVNCIKYGLPEGNRFAAFDIMRGGRWLNADEARSIGRDLNWVPDLSSAKGLPYDFKLICDLAEGNSLVLDAKPGTIREGVVVKPVRERLDPEVGRVCFKCVNPTFLERR